MVRASCQTTAPPGVRICSLVRLPNASSTKVVSLPRLSCQPVRRWAVSHWGRQPCTAAPPRADDVARPSTIRLLPYSRAPNPERQSEFHPSCRVRQNRQRPRSRLCSSSSQSHPGRFGLVGMLFAKVRALVNRFEPPSRGCPMSRSRHRRHAPIHYCSCPRTNRTTLR